jgi:hypothetical protein
VSEPSGQGKPRSGWSGGSGDSWERRAADLANDVQRWLIKSSARNMRDELRGQVKKTFRGQDSSKTDVWATATTEPPGAGDQPPECAWCPICRAARRMAQAQAQGGSGAAATPADAAPKGAGPGLAGAADMLAGAARDALAGLDAILSYRPPDAGTEKGTNGAATDQASGDQASGDQASGDRASSDRASSDRTSSEQGKEPDHEPDHRG